MTLALLSIIILSILILLVGTAIAEHVLEKKRKARELEQARQEAMRYQRPPRPTYTSPVPAPSPKLETTTLELKPNNQVTTVTLPARTQTTVVRRDTDEASVILADVDDVPLSYFPAHETPVIDMYKGTEPGQVFTTPVDCVATEPERATCSYVAPTPSYSYSDTSSSHSSSSHSSSYSSSSYDSGSSYSSSSDSSSSSSSDSSSW